MIVIDGVKCIGCGRCIRDCFPSDIELKEKQAVPKNEACNLCGHCIAVCPVNAVSMNDYDMKEVKEYEKDSFAVSSENLLNFIKFRRSVRYFQNRQVEREKIERIIEAGRFTPTASNRQEVSYIVIEKEIEKVTDLALESLNRAGHRILSDNEVTDQTVRRYSKRWITMYETRKKKPAAVVGLFFNAPVVVVITASSAVDGALAASNMELMVNAEGLGMFYSGFFVRAVKESEQLREFLRLQEGREVTACLVIGYPAVKYLRTVPRRKSDIIWR
jgi:nitroreductase/NAD-dependent dihydropyrimidine dehydrogenase PreA subunit